MYSNILMSTDVRLIWLIAIYYGHVYHYAEQGQYVTEFWKITLMGVPETIRIFEFKQSC